MSINAQVWLYAFVCEIVLLLDDIQSITYARYAKSSNNFELFLIELSLVGFNQIQI